MKILTYKDYLDKKYYLSNLNKECIISKKCFNILKEEINDSVGKTK